MWQVSTHILIWKIPVTCAGLFFKAVRSPSLPWDYWSGMACSIAKVKSWQPYKKVNWKVLWSGECVLCQMKLTIMHFRSKQVKSIKLLTLAFLGFRYLLARCSDRSFGSEFFWRVLRAESKLPVTIWSDLEVPYDISTHDRHLTKWCNTRPTDYKVEVVSNREDDSSWYEDSMIP